ncbi:hypothetical protein [Halomonas sp. LBP4]|uniref:hypothetical protein n=1 Tax=Halomonas sp. LBP4 TaxID=2044917 RepID=UPI000D7516A1|nr:hypothetical protein [Halomonas sp. LBP4]PXX99353.1 hypothetical protein CR157_00760 [Halomonas sp. LBP4]
MSICRIPEPRADRIIRDYRTLYAKANGQAQRLTRRGDRIIVNDGVSYTLAAVVTMTNNLRWRLTGELSCTMH